MRQIDMLAQRVRPDEVVIDGESAVLKRAGVAAFHAAVHIGVMEGVHGLGVVAEGGVGGVDDAACGAVNTRMPQLDGTLGVLYDGTIL